MSDIDPQEILDRLDRLGGGAVRHLTLEDRADIRLAAQLIRDQIEMLDEFGAARDLPADGWRVYWRNNPSEPWGEHHGVGVYRDEEGAKRAEAEYREMGHDTMRRPLTYVVTDARIWDAVRDRIAFEIARSTPGNTRFDRTDLVDRLTTIALGEREAP